ncbi:MAG TPA: Ig-like domain-containing protein [Gemmatimonadales bacterium]|jgi:uncharacterized protein YjdB
MYVRKLLALGAVLLSVACEIPVDTSGSNPDFGVTSVAIQPKTASVLVGDSLQLSASVIMSNNRPPNSVTWASTDVALATVSSTGVVHGRAAGGVFIRATSGSKRDSSAVTVAAPSPLPVASVTLAPSSVTVTVGGTVSLVATLKDANGNTLAGRVVTWVSSNPGAATVSGTGLATAVTVGSTTITATSEGQSGSATVSVTAVPVASVSVSPATASVQAGQTVQLSASPKDASGTALSGRTVTWASSNVGVATVSGGVVSGVAAGSVTISATSEGQSGTATVSVTAVPVASVSVSPATASVSAGQTVQLTASPKDASGNTLSGRTVTWASSNAGVATVSANGLVSGIAAGSVTITATSEGRSGTSALTVTAAAALPSTVSDLAVPTITDSSATLSFTEVNDGAGQPASYDIRYVAGPTLTWGGSVPSVSRGTCATPIAGTAIGAKRTCTVLGLTAGTTYSFQMVAYRGTLTVNAVFGGLSNVATATTRASTAPIASVTLTPASGSVTVGNVLQVTATLKDAGGNVLLGRAVTWASGNTGVATVNGTGLVTGLGAGSAIITATSEGVNGTASVTVSAGSGGGTLLLQEDFADAGFATRGWYDDYNLPVTTAQHMAGSTSALEIHLAPGAVYAPFGTSARHAFQPTSTLYVSYWVKYSDNWVGSATPDHPHEFYILSNQDGQYAPLADDWLTTYIETNFVNGAGTPRVSLQDNLAINRSMGTTPINLIGVTEQRSVSGCNGMMETNLFSECYGSGTYNDKQFNRVGTAVFQAQSGAGYKGNWNHVEVYLQMNSIVNGVGVPDGVIQYWYNGVLAIDRHDVMFRTGARASLAFAQFVIGPYIGSGSPVDQTMWVDNLMLATQHP